MAKSTKSKNSVATIIADTQQIFNDAGYVFVKDILDKEIVTLASQYALFDQIQNFQPESGANAQTPGTHSQYADPLMESLLLKLHPIIEKHTGLTQIVNLMLDHLLDISPNLLNQCHKLLVTKNILPLQNNKIWCLKKL